MEIPPLIKGQKCVLLTAFRSSGAHIALRWEDGNSEERNRRPPVKYEVNPSIGLGGVREHTYIHTYIHTDIQTEDVTLL